MGFASKICEDKGDKWVERGAKEWKRDLKGI